MWSVVLVDDLDREDIGSRTLATGMSRVKAEEVAANFNKEVDEWSTWYAIVKKEV